MLSAVVLQERTYLVDWERPIDIAIPLNFSGPQPNAFGAERARAEPVRAGNLVGDTREGGSCNFEQLTLIPHCNGTHTECVGHITHERISVRDCLSDVLVPAALVSLETEPASASGEGYAIAFGVDDKLITRRALENSLKEHSDAQALIVRTIPNDDEKLLRDYSGEPLPPYFSTEAIEFIMSIGIKHLMVDVPSIDRLHDMGKLANHRTFWKIEAGKFEINEGSRMGATITELIYVPNHVPDGLYLSNLQIAPFSSDASPSRPVLFQATIKEDSAT